MAIQLVLAEYGRLKEEQLRRIILRDGLVSVTFVIVGTAISLVVGNDTAGPEIILVVPLVTLVLGWTYLTNDRMISLIGAYLSGPLRTQADEIAELRLIGFRWEDFHRKSHRRPRWKFAQLLVDLLLFVVPGLVAAGQYLAAGPTVKFLLVIAAAEVLFSVVLGYLFVLAGTRALSPDN